MHGGLQKEAGTAADIEKTAAIGRQQGFENLQPIGLRQLRPGLVFAGMRQKSGLLAGVIILAIGALEVGGGRQGQGMLKAAHIAFDDVVRRPRRHAPAFVDAVADEIICGCMAHAIADRHKLLTAS